MSRRRIKIRKKNDCILYGETRMSGSSGRWWQKFEGCKKTTQKVKRKKRVKFLLCRKSQAKNGALTVLTILWFLIILSNSSLIFLYFSSVWGVRTYEASGSGLSQPLCSFLFSACSEHQHRDRNQHRTGQRVVLTPLRLYIKARSSPSLLKWSSMRGLWPKHSSGSGLAQSLWPLILNFWNTIGKWIGKKAYRKVVMLFVFITLVPANYVQTYIYRYHISCLNNAGLQTCLRYQPAKVTGLNRRHLKETRVKFKHS